MDAPTAPQVDTEAASGDALKPPPCAYPHLWFDDRGRPWIDDTNLKVIEVVLDHTAYRMSAEEINREYPYLSLAQIHSALAYYFDHKQEMDDEIERQREEYEELRERANAESPLLKRLRAQGKIP